MAILLNQSIDYTANQRKVYNKNRMFKLVESGEQENGPGRRTKEVGVQASL